MANKRRPPLSFPELEPKGRGAILRSSEEIQAEQDMLETQQAVMPESQHASIPESHQNGMPAAHASDNRAAYPKATYRLSQEAFEAIDDTKRILRRQYRIRASLEEIAEEAILAVYRDLLANTNASILVNKFAGKAESQKL